MSRSLGAFIQKKYNTLVILKSPSVCDMGNVISFPFSLSLSDSVGSHPMRKVRIYSFQCKKETTKAYPLLELEVNAVLLHKTQG